MHDFCFYTVCKKKTKQARQRATKKKNNNNKRNNSMGETDKARHGLDLFNYAKAPACRLAWRGGNHGYQSETYPTCLGSLRTCIKSASYLYIINVRL